MKTEQQHSHKASQILWRLLKENRKFVSWWFVLLVFTLVTTLLISSIPLVVKEIIDQALLKNNTALLFQLLCLLFSIYLVHILLEGVKTYIQTLVGQRAVAIFRLRLFRKILSLPAAFYDRHPTGDILNRMEGDINVVDFLTSRLLFLSFSQIMMMMYSLGMMAYLDWRLFLVSAVLFPTVYAVQMYFGKKIKQKTLQLRTFASGIFTATQESIIGIRFIQEMGRRLFVGTRYIKSLRSVIRQQLQLARFSVFASAAMSGNVIFMLLISYGLGGYFVTQDLLTLGTLIAFNTYIEKLYSSLTVASTYWIEMQRAAASVERLYWLLDQPSLSRDGQRLERLQGHIVFRDVSFHYEGKQQTLEDITFDIQPATTTAIVGASGSGKSTLLSLIMGHYPVAKGNIFIDGIPLSSLSLTSLRKKIGVVSQQPFFFLATIRENLQLVKREATDEELYEVLEEVGLGGWVKELPNGLDTMVGERGLQLSGGQRQKLALSRVILQNPDIIILDEATAFLDNLSEEQIKRLLRSRFFGKTIVMVAHRLSMVREADQVIMIENGRICAQGTHEYLFATSLSYQALWKDEVSAFT
ncbi:ABC transporter ATP-binding protein [Aneurinibacillus thermoaerophilus]|uniref:ABC transporter ATP-binding protein n=1 Tax=Aneurinibacillus thermoaerophilus TaxID=143495 RepID=UPI002E24A757|nr:ABC transporter ATP-binding protein [Aneurinibacillus thermoaerophilus]